MALYPEAYLSYQYRMKVKKGRLIGLNKELGYGVEECQARVKESEVDYRSEVRIVRIKTSKSRLIGRVVRTRLVSQAWNVQFHSLFSVEA